MVVMILENYDFHPLQGRPENELRDKHNKQHARFEWYIPFFSKKLPSAQIPAVNGRSDAANTTCVYLIFS